MALRRRAWSLWRRRQGLRRTDRAAAWSHGIQEVVCGVIEKMGAKATLGTPRGASADRPRAVVRGFSYCHLAASVPTREFRGNDSLERFRQGRRLNMASSVNMVTAREHAETLSLSGGGHEYMQFQLKRPEIGRRELALFALVAV